MNTSLAYIYIYIAILLKEELQELIKSYKIVCVN
jgi:hypothetical protein